MAAPFTSYVDPLVWYDGETMTELKLDGQQGNSDFLRDMGRNRPIVRAIATNADEYDTGGGTLADTAQVRLSVRPLTTTPTFWTDPVTVRLGLGQRIKETDWVAVTGSRNVNWSVGAGSGMTFEVRWEWRADDASSWNFLGERYVPGIAFGNEYNGYVSLWAEVIAFANARRWGGSTANGWIVVATRGLSVLSGRVNEFFT